MKTCQYSNRSGIDLMNWIEVAELPSTTGSNPELLLKFPSSFSYESVIQGLNQEQVVQQPHLLFIKFRPWGDIFIDKVLCSMRVHETVVPNFSDTQTLPHLSTKLHNHVNCWNDR